MWLSYVMLILIVLCAVSCGLLIALARSPLLYRTTLERIRIAQVGIATSISLLPDKTQIEPFLIQEATARGIRLFILSNNGFVLFDTTIVGQTPFPTIHQIPIVPAALSNDALQLPVFRDGAGNGWFYALEVLPDGRYLAVTDQKPKFPLRIFFRDELFVPLVISAFVALGLAFLISAIMGRWIATPLQRMATSANKLAEGQLVNIPLEGPGEVQQLAGALNEMNQKVNNSTQSQRDFVANVSHELKTPLTSIQGFAQSILDGTTTGEHSSKEAAEIIFNEAGRMNRLVMDLLTLAKLEGGTAGLRRAEVNLGELLSRVGKKFQPQAHQANVELKSDIAALPRFIGDGDRLAQVFTNLLDNALKFTPAGGTVNIQAIVIDARIHISISDTGLGIPPEEQTRIFERFYQVDKSRKGGIGRGIGLGLPIAKQIILAHNGQIQVLSNPGQGTTFTVDLPCSNSQDQTLSIKKAH
jgi:signal transduction histidine kinase